MKHECIPAVTSAGSSLKMQVEGHKPIGVTYGSAGVRIPPLFGVRVQYPHFLGV